MSPDLDGTIRKLSLREPLSDEELRALVAAFEATLKLPPPDPDKTVPLPGRTPAPALPDLISLAAAKGLLDEATARRTLGDREASFNHVVVARLLADTAAREIMLENPDTLCRDCGRPLTPLGSERVCTPCGVRRKHEDPRETEVRRLPPDVAAAARDEANVFGKYVRLEELGHGGMGAVYRAWDRELSRVVALKLPKFDSREDLERFKREAELMASLGHPNIAAIYEIGEARGAMYLAMQLISGASAAKRDFDVREAVRIVRDAARAVAAAHEKGVIHRDLKPENVMVDRAGRVYVLDFGLARRQEAEKSVSQSILAGTPAYMAPEHARGQALDQRADVYSLGATLYALAVGVQPFIGPAGDVIKRVQEEEPTAPRRMNPKIPRDVEIMIQKAMCKEKARRYASATELAADLERYLNGEAITARPATWTYRTSRKVKRNPAAWALGATAAVIALGVAGYLAGSAVVRHRRLVEDKRAARAIPEAERALAAWTAVRGRAPGDPEAVERVATLTNEVTRVRRLGGIREEIREKLAAHEEARGRSEAAGARAAELAQGVQDWTPFTQKIELWRAQRERDEAGHEAERARVELGGLYAQVLALAADDAEAFAGLTELAWEEYQRAREANDERRMATAAARVRDHDRQARYAAALREIGTLALATIPPGATATAYRYGESEDRRLLPGDEPIDLGATPVRADLRRGSYLVILSHEGFRDVRYPVWIDAEETWEGTVRLLPEAEIGEGWIYVPGGKFQAGGDPEAPNAWPAGRREVGDFVIAKYEVTMQEYEEFIRDLLATDPNEARRRAPRNTDQTPLWNVAADQITYNDTWKRWPVIGVSWEDATAYCAWRSRKDREWEYMLPTEEQWEKAGRGVDGRFFPWGNEFDWSFTMGNKSRERVSGPEAVGAFEADESPYGVRDMAGSAYEFCADWYQEGSTRNARGGAWGAASAFAFRMACRFGFDPSLAITDAGFRLARVPEGF